MSAVALTGALAVVVLCLSTAPLLARPQSPFRHGSVVVVPSVAVAAATLSFSVLANQGVLDKTIYLREFRLISAATFPDAFVLQLASDHEPAYVALLWLVGRGGDDIAWLYAWIGAVCLGALVVAARLLLSWWQVPVLLVTTISLGFFTAYTSNTVRQGLSLALLVLGVCLVLRRASWWWWTTMLAASTLFHWSAAPAAGLVLAFAVLRPRLRTVLVAWCVAAALFVTGLQEHLLGPLAQFVPALDTYMSDELVATYTGGTNRIDFLAFSAVFLVVGVVAVRRASVPSWYPALVGAYALLNVYFLLFGFIAFSDRLAAYSWSLAPFVLAVPFLDPRSGTGHAVTVAFVAGVVAVGLATGPLAQMIGLAPY